MSQLTELLGRMQAGDAQARDAVLDTSVHERIAQKRGGDRPALTLSNGLGSREVERAMGIELTRAVPRELENKWLVRQRIPSVMSV